MIILFSATKARVTDEVQKLVDWKQPALQINKATKSRSRESETSRLRHSIDGLSSFNRNKDLPGLPKYSICSQDRAVGRMTYSGLALPSVGRSSTESARMSMKVQLSPVSENLLKRYSNEVSEAELNSLSRSLQTGAVSGVHSNNTNHRQQSVNRHTNLQQQRMTESSSYPYIATTPSTSGDEEDEEDDDIDEDREGTENSSGNPSIFIANTSNSRGHALPDGFSSRQKGGNVDLEQHSQSRRLSTDLGFCKGGSSPEQTGLPFGTKYTTGQQEDVSIGNPSQVWQDNNNSSTSQQPLDCSTSNQYYRASDPYAGAKPKFADVQKEPTTPKFRESSQSNQTLVSCMKASDRNTLHDPIYDPNFTGPQIIKRRQSRFAQQAFDGDADHDRIGTNNAELQSSCTHALASGDARETHHASGLYRKQLVSGVYGDEIKSFHRGQEVTAQSNSNFPSLYNRQQTGSVVRQTESLGPPVLPQQGQPPMHIDYRLSHVNELPELVKGIAKITAAFDSSNQQGYHISHGAIDNADRGHSGADACSMRVAGQDTVADRSSSHGLGLKRGTRQPSSNDPSNSTAMEGRVRWSSAEMPTPSREAYQIGQTQSKA
ncbi:hypothetical protein L7F22_032014 [Adiantum nelumboides]|nr:hypothetical protein [Adiantum nelumboides]